MRRNDSDDRAVARLRARLARLDRNLVRALQEREETQWLLLSLKGQKGYPLTDRAQERTVRGRARDWALAERGDPDLAEEVLAAAIASGKRRFEARRADATGGTAASIATPLPRPAVRLAHGRRGDRPVEPGGLPLAGPA